MCCCMTHLGKKAWLLNTAHVGSKDLYTIKISGDFSHIMRESYMRLLINQDRLGDLFFVVYPTTILGHFPSCRARWSCRRMSSDSTFQSSSRPPLWTLKFDGDLGGFPVDRGYRKMDGKKTKMGNPWTSQSKMDDDRGYPHFRKPPFHD